MESISIPLPQGKRASNKIGPPLIWGQPTKCKAVGLALDYRKIVDRFENVAIDDWRCRNSLNRALTLRSYDYLQHISLLGRPKCRSEILSQLFENFKFGGRCVPHCY